MNDELDLEFCTVSIYENYLIVVINEGIHVTPEYNEILEAIVVKYFRKTPFVYLTWRKNSYSVDPAIYKKTLQINNLVGFGIIVNAIGSSAKAQIEKAFISIPFQIFETKEEAEDWVQNLLKSSSTL